MPTARLHKPVVLILGHMLIEMIGGLVIANMVSNITVHLDHGLRIIYDPPKVTKPRPSGFFVHRYSGDKVRRILLLLLRFMWVQRQLAFFGRDQGHSNLNNKRYQFHVSKKKSTELIRNLPKTYISLKSSTLC